MLRSSLHGLLFALLLAAFAPPALAAPCTTGQTTCNTDTVNNDRIAQAIRDPTVQLNVLSQWLGYCFSSVWNEVASTPGNAARVRKCNQIATGVIDRQLLVAAIMNAQIQGEVLGSCGIPQGIGPAAGCMVNVDVGNSIAALMTTTVSSASTTATAASGSTLLAVVSATGINPDMNVYGAGIPSGTIVTNVSGTNVAISVPTTAALAVTPVLFTISTGLP